MPRPSDAQNGFGALDREILNFGQLAWQWQRKIHGDVTEALEAIGEAWKTGAQRRVPVNEGTLRESIVAEVSFERGSIVLVVGTNVDYSIFIEFGTRFIAKGEVLALGTDPEITDAMAVKTWPALEGRDGSGQQMPWLRPAFQAIRPQAEARLDEAIDPGDLAA